MSEPYIGEIRIMPYSYAPQNWAWCEGGTIQISQFQALYAVIGSIYGGDDRTYFNLPNLKGSSPLGSGQAPGLSAYAVGENGGSNTVTLLAQELPQHSHTAYALRELGSSQSPDNTKGVGAYKHNRVYYHNPDSNNLTQMADAALAEAGGSQPHENRQPFLALNFCIALDGLFPDRP